MTAKEILLKAAEFILRDGHTKCRYKDDNGACCAIGAIYKAATGEANPYTGGGICGDPNPEIALAGKLLREKVGGEFISLWNDRFETSKEDVAAAMVEAANSESKYSYSR